MGAMKQYLMEEASKPQCEHGGAHPCELLCTCGHICADHGPECSGASDCDCTEFNLLSDEDDEFDEDAEIERNIEESSSAV
jgi:hypothetical protein